MTSLHNNENLNKETACNTFHRIGITCPNVLSRGDFLRDIDQLLTGNLTIVGAERFELSASSSRTMRANQTALRPEKRHKDSKS